MAELTVQAPAKINLHLEVLGLRADGFHELAMVMQSLDLVDHLHLRPTADARLNLSCDDPTLGCGPENLIVRAAAALRARVGLPELGAAIQLQKRIPVGAGLAGGSSDAAATLLGLQRLWGLELEPAALMELAADLGSDVPYCLQGGLQLCFGRGERLEPAAGPGAAGLGVLLVKDPSASVSTPWAYGRCRELRGDFYLEREDDFEQRRQALRQGPLLAALGRRSALPPLRNDLQSVVAPEVGSVARALAILRQAPDALAVAMSGSGPSVFALFDDGAGAERAAATLAESLAAEGLAWWCTRTRPTGVSLEVDSSVP
jgi:4-diphosphocytidyl-2-C-methyl-D-erythritol kinase